MNFNGNNNASSPFARAVSHRESLWRERSERARHGGRGSASEVGVVRVKDLRDFSNEAYYRDTGPAQFIDTYGQDPRPVGGDYTQVRGVVVNDVVSVFFCVFLSKLCLMSFVSVLLSMTMLL